MIIGILVGGIFLGFSLWFARNDRLQDEEAQETTGHLIRTAIPIPRINRSFPARPQASGASCLLTP